MYKNNFVVAVKHKGSILRERNNSSVYLPFGAEYSILLKNKDARRALVNIEVDGKSVLKNQKLILDGNDTQEIKGFMRNMNKTNRFKFIQKTREIQEYRGDRLDDGLIRVTYQFEDISPKPPNIFSGITYYGTDYIKSSNTVGSPFRDTDCEPRAFCCVNSTAPMQDEGITVKGERISQEYSYGDIGPVESQTNTIILRLKGQTRRKKKVRKAVTVKSKFTCETCGRKNKSQNKFCYNCGTYLEKH